MCCIVVVANAQHYCVSLQLCSRGTWVDGDGVTGSNNNSALPAEDSLSAGLFAAVDGVSLLELDCFFAAYSL